MEIPTKITKDEDKIKFLYRTLELLRLEHNAKGKDFIGGKMSKKEFKTYQKGEFMEKTLKIFAVLNPLKKKLGMFQLDPLTNPSVLPDDQRLFYKDDGKKETKWDSDINLKQI